jgi:hypothetical protein
MRQFDWRSVLCLLAMTACGEDVAEAPAVSDDVEMPADADTGQTTPDGGEDVTAAGDTSVSPPDDTAGGDGSFEPPIHVVFKVHIEPQSTVEVWRTRRDAVEAVRGIAEGFGARLTIHGNGEYFQYALDEGEAAHVEGWIGGGHDVGVHAHGIHQDPDGAHRWPNLPPDADAAMVREAWEDHHRALAALVPEHVIDQATPWNSDDAAFVSQMEDFGYRVLGGGRHEIGVAWFGHAPFFPFRVGARHLEEDLGSPVVMVHHSAQIEEADYHGPPGGRTFQDQTVPHLKTQFLQLHLNRLHAERTGDPSDRIWMFGFLTHDNKSPPEVLAAIETFMTWVEAHFGGGRESARGHRLMRWASTREVVESFEAWEAAHPGVSSHHVATPTPIDARDATRISAEASRAAYRGAFWGLAQLLKATEAGVVDHVAVHEDFAAVGVACHELAFGPRERPETRDKRFVLYKETDGEVVVDLRALSGETRLRSWDPVTLGSTEVDAAAMVVGAVPVIVERVGAPTPF